MLEGMEGMDWYWLMLIRCSNIFGLVVVLVLITFGLTSNCFKLLNNTIFTILLDQGLSALPLFHWTDSHPIWRLDVVVKFPKFLCLRFRLTQWSFRHCVGHRYCKSRVRWGRWEYWWLILIWVPCCRRGQRLWGFYSIFEHRNCRNLVRLPD